MRSIGMQAAVTGALVLTSACSDGGGTTPPDNVAPVATFTAPTCTVNVECTFTSTSTDDVAVTEHRWDLNGDGTPDKSGLSVTNMYTAAGQVSVILTVVDAGGLTGTKVNLVTVSAAPVVNAAPVATFTAPTGCIVGTACTFTDASTDDVAVTGWSWDFNGDGTADANTASFAYAYTAAGTYQAKLTVSDGGTPALSDDVTQTVTVAPPNTPPTAGFNHICSAANCSFTSTSIDAAPGIIATYAWDFGDGATAAVSNPSHRYAIVNATDFTVTLTVTDNDGATDVETQTITVSPPTPGAEGCTTSGIRTDCLLDIADQSIIKLKLIGISCTLNGQRVVIPAPSSDAVFLSVCSRAVGDSTKIFGGPGDQAFVYEAGSQATIRFVQGTAKRGEPTPSAPAAQLTGSFPSWTINFEDGANPGGPSEPDFTDVVLQVEAVPPQ